MWSHHLGLSGKVSIALFPMVIITMTIERMCICWDESGPGNAIQQGICSLIVAISVYPFIVSQTISDLIFTFPELLLIVLGLCIFLGRYSGYRVMELFRFRAMLKAIDDV